MMESSYIKNAFLHILLQIVNVFFVMPFRVWEKALTRLASQRETKSLKVSEIKSQWPVFTFLKRWFVDFLFDALIALFWLIALILYFKHNPFRFFNFYHFICTLYLIYFGVVIISVLRDAFVLALRPLVKFLSWLNKPAQHLDLTINKEDQGASFYTTVFEEPVTVPETPVMAENTEPSADFSKVGEWLKSKKGKITIACILGAALVGLIILLLTGKSKDVAKPSVEAVKTEDTKSEPVKEEPVVEAEPEEFSLPPYDSSFYDYALDLVSRLNASGMTADDLSDIIEDSQVSGIQAKYETYDGIRYQMFFDGSPNNPQANLTGIAISEEKYNAREVCYESDRMLDESFQEASKNVWLTPKGIYISPGVARGRAYYYIYMPNAPSKDAAPR